MRRIPDSAQQPLRVALVHDYEIVLHGLALMLWPYRHRVVLTELDAVAPTAASVDVALIDVALIDTAPDGAAHLDGWGVDDVLGRTDVGKVVVYGWAPPSEAEKVGLRGASGFLSKGLGAADLVAGLERVHRQGDPVVLRHSRAREPIAHGWPGREAGLTHREGEMVMLISQGKSNQLIAEQTFLSINSVKSYIRTAYRKMEVTSRSQAVLWGLTHGLGPETTRLGPGSNVHSLALVAPAGPWPIDVTFHPDRETS